MATTLNLEWSDGLNGGYMSPANPQVMLTVPAAKGLTKVRLAMVRDDPKLVTGLILVVCRGSAQLTAKPGDSEIAAKSKYLSSSSVTINIELASGTYRVLCCEGKPVGTNKKFTLSAENATLASPTITGCTLKHSLPMSGAGAAGYGSSKNPQFFLQLTKTSTVIISFEAEAFKGAAGADAGAAGTAVVDGKAAACLWMQKAPKAGERLDDFPTGPTRILTSPFYRGDYVDATAKDVPPGSYVILVMKSLKTPSVCNVSVQAVDDADAKLSGEVFKEETVKDVPCSKIVGSVSKPPLMHKVSEKSAAPCAFYDQDVARQLVDTINGALKPGEAFVDEAFPHADSSINNCPDVDKKLTEAACWRRPAQLVSAPALFTDGASADDIAQGALGNCWFCATVAAVGGLRPDVASRMFYPAQYNAKGVYAVTLFLDQAQKAIIIDDALPAKNGGSTLAFAHSSDKTEFWFSLIEKAFAKAVGGYQALMGRAGRLSSTPVMSMMTGGAGSNANLGDVDAAWAKTVEYTSHKWLVTTGTRETAVKDTGLVGAHAYTVLNAVEANGIKLVHCRNTWGRGEWTGDWSDSSDMWRKHPAIANKCGVNPDAPQDDGNFWMPFDAFCGNFSGLNLCKFMDEAFPHSAEYKGLLPTKEVQNPNFPARCDQIYVELSKPGAAVAIQLSAKDAKWASFKVWNVADDGKIIKRLSGDLLYTGLMIANPRAEIQLPSDCKRCILIPRTDAEKTEYTLTVHSTCPLKLVATEPAPACVLPMKWPAGGCKYQKPECPTVEITIPEPQWVALNLTLTMSADFKRQGLKVAMGEGAPGGAEGPWPKPSLTESKFLVTTVLTHSTDELAPGKYTLRATTHTPVDASGVLTVSAETKVTAKQLL